MDQDRSGWIRMYQDGLGKIRIDQDRYIDQDTCEQIPAYSSDVMHYVFGSSLSRLVYSCKFRGTGRDIFFPFHSRVYGIMFVCMSVASLLHSFTTSKGQVSGQRYTSNTSKQPQNNLWALPPTIIRRHSQAGHQYRFALWLLTRGQNAYPLPTLEQPCALVDLVGWLFHPLLQCCHAFTVIIRTCKPRGSRRKGRSLDIGCGCGVHFGLGWRMFLSDNGRHKCAIWLCSSSTDSHGIDVPECYIISVYVYI